MKKLLSLAMSLTICVSGMTAVTSNALYGWFVLTDENIPTYYKPDDELNNLFGLFSESEGLLYEDNNGCVEFIQPISDIPNSYAFQTFTWEFNVYEINNDESYKLKDYISKEYPEFIVDGDSTLWYIGGSEYSNLSENEKFKIALDIKEKLGIIPLVCLLEEVNVNTDNLQIFGDADMDGNVTISDAAQIMAFTSNSAKYPISEMAQTVGDVYNTGDGINNMDALQIQRMLANID